VVVDEILYGGDDVEDDIDSPLLNLVASTILKWRTYKLVRCVQILMKFCIGVMALNITPTTYYLIT
jgi:hypothetical protein